MASNFTSGCSDVVLTLRDDGRLEVGGQTPTRNWPAAMEAHRKIVEMAAAEYQIAPALIAAFVCHESGGKPNIRGGDGEYGLMQIMPSTWRGVTGHLPTDAEGLDPTQNVLVGSYLIAQLMQKQKGNILRVGASYNAGSPRCGVWSGCNKASRWNLATACGYLDDLIASYNTALDNGYSATPPALPGPSNSNSGGSGGGRVVAAIIGVGAIFGAAWWLKG